jgi:transposase
MRDTELYRHLLGLEGPWAVSKVDLSVATRRVDVWAEHKKGATFHCPECNAACGLHDHAEERVWKHLDSCQFATYLHARIPRVQCAEHGVGQARVPWAEPRSRFTLLFERFAIDVLKETGISGAATILGLSWDETQHLMERAVARGRARKAKVIPSHIGVDEKAIAKGHTYMTLVCDLKQGTVEYATEGRTEASLLSYFGPFTLDDVVKVEAVAMDMWQPFLSAVTRCVPYARDKIVFDRFHIVAHMNGAVDIVRRAEAKALRAEGDEMLKGTRYLWLYGQENVPEHQVPTFDALKALNLKTGRAWAIKEMLRELWECGTLDEATAFHRRWHHWATHSRLQPVIKVAKMVRSHLHNILTYFTQRVTNAVSEGINSAIQTIKKRAFGYRNPQHFKTAIYFHCGGLDLYPAFPSHGVPG